MANTPSVFPNPRAARELRGTVGVHAAKYQSFELYRRNLYEPEIVTFDELLARAEWHVELAELES